MPDNQGNQVFFGMERNEGNDKILQAAKEILIHDMNSNCLYGFSKIYLNKGNNKESSSICIYT